MTDTTIIDISHLVTIKNWAENYGLEKSGRPYTASYAYKLFDPNTTTPAATEVKAQFEKVEIDGVTFVSDRKLASKKGFIFDITKLLSFKSWAVKYGIEKSGRSYTASYAYKLFDPESTSPAALEVQQIYAKLSIDGVVFITEIVNIPKKYLH